MTEGVGSVRSIALGLWIRTGSRDESPAQAGLSHFLEHLLFKGTDRFTSREIDETFDSLGAEVNAGTGKETTSVYSRFLDRHLDQAFDVLSDMVLHPSYPDIDSERDVVIEEIAMYEDEPQDKVHDILSTAVFGDHPLGRPIIGRADVVSSVPVPEIAAFHDERYVGGNLVLAALFHSLLFPVSILTTILVSFIGVFWFFFLTGTEMSMMGMIGLLVLMGIVVNNGIVLVDHINNLRREGLSREAAVIQGGRRRSRRRFLR